MLIFFLTSCQEAKIGINKINLTFGKKPEITRVEVVNDQLLVTGKNLDTVNLAEIRGSTNHTFDLESKTKTSLVLNSRSALNLLVGHTFNLFISNASASATFPISFELQNGQVTAEKLNSMGATAGQILRFNGANWAPSTPLSGQIYGGTFNATTETPDIASTTPLSGTYYIVTVAGTPDLGNGSLSLSVGDLVIYNGSDWERVAVGTLGVTSFNGRDSVVMPVAGDYTWDLLAKSSGKLTGSNLGDIEDVDLTGVIDGHVLKWNAGLSMWVAAVDDSGGVVDGSVTTAKLSDGSVTSAKIVDGTIGNTDIANSSITEQKLNLSDNSVSINKIQRLACLAGEVLTSDTILGYRCVVDNTTDTTKLPLAGGTMTGSLVLAADPSSGLQAATKQYVDTLAATSPSWTVSGNDIYNSNSGNVGIGTSTPSSPLHVSGNVLIDGSDVGRTITIQNNSSTSAIFPQLNIINHMPSASIAGAPVIQLENRQGPNGSTQGLISGSSLGFIQFAGSDELSNNRISALISARASEAWSSTNHGTNLIFATSENGTAVYPATKVIISHKGNLGVGVNTPLASLHLNKNVTDTTWSTTGKNFAINNNTLTDTTGSGTIPLKVSSSLGTPTFASSVATTLTNAANLYIAGAPLAGTNTTITNSSSLYVDSGNSYFGGSVGIGTSTPTNLLSLMGNGSDANIESTAYENGTFSNHFYFNKARGTASIPLMVSNGDQLGTILYSGYDGDSFVNSAAISVRVDGPPADESIPSRITFSTGSVGGNMLERLRINSSGNLGVGTTNPQAKLHVAGNLRVDTLNAATATQVCIDGSNVLSSCSSSIRYKENVLDLNSSLMTILGLRPVSYDWLSSGEQDVGFIAEEVEKVDKRLVTYNKDNKIQGVKYDQLSAPIVKAIQEVYSMLKDLSQNVASIELDHQHALENANFKIKKLEKENLEKAAELSSIKNYICSKDPSAHFCQ